MSAAQSFLILLTAWMVSGCFGRSPGESPAETFPAATGGIISYAKGFQLSDHPDYQLLSVFSPFSTIGDTIQYVLVREGKVPPDHFAPDQVIQVPVRSIAVTSSSHVGAIDRLEAWNSLVAVGDGDQIYSERIRDKIRGGKVIEIQKGVRLNEEKVIELQPDVLIVTGSSDAGSAVYAGIRQSGIPVIINSEWMENTPLGRAEWIKLMAALLDRLNFAEHQFALVESSYRNLAERVAQNTTTKPAVLLGNEFQGTWYMPGGESFMARLLADAGADYPWKDNDQTGGIPFNFEAVYPIALDADVWLNITDPARNTGRKDLLLSNPRYKDFKSVKDDRLYSFTKRVDENNINDYWESAVYRPDLLLADYVHILHPDLLPDHLLYYCKKLD